MGSANAAVLPLPVCAVPIASRPPRMAGMQPRCTAVGRCMPRDLHTLSHATWLTLQHPTARSLNETTVT